MKVTFWLLTVYKQVAPATPRIRESFGITEEQLLKSGIKEKETSRFFWRLTSSTHFITVFQLLL